MDLVAVDQGAAERFSLDTPLCIGGRPFQTAFPECSGPYTLGGFMKVKVQKFVSVCIYTSAACAPVIHSQN